MSFDEQEPLTRRDRAFYIGGIMFCAAVVLGWVTLLTVLAGVGLAKIVEMLR